MIDPAAQMGDPVAQAIWAGMLLGTDPTYARNRARLKHVPGEPRCKMCAAPFGNPGAPFMRLIGRGRWPKNPLYCGQCFAAISNLRGGAEIEASFLFADVRGSTSLAEGMSPTAFRARLVRFYDTAARILIDRDAIVDKFIGDEVMAIFIPALTQDAHAARAIDAGLALLRAMGHGDRSGPWLPIGVGVNTGVAYVGSVGSASPDLTALGDVVNTTARLASAAAAGEMLVTDAAASASGFDTSKLERRSLDLKGKAEATSVAVATVSTGRP